MKQSRHGPLISGFILIALVVAGAAVYFILRITPPTDLSENPANMAPLAPPAPAHAIIDLNESGDAAQLYRAAIVAYQDNPTAVDRYAASPVGPQPQAIALVLGATHKPGSNLFESSPEEIVNFDNEHPPLAALEQLGQSIDQAALVLRKLKDLDKARDFFSATYSLGQRLFDERLTHDEYFTGLGLMNESAQGLAECEPPHSPSAAELSQLAQQRIDFDAVRVAPIQQVLMSADQDVIAANAGDVFAFATRAGERMFRVEAILKLGRYRFDAARSADQLAAPRYLKRFSTDPDPVIRAAAAAAQALTIEQYRTLH